MTYPKRLDIELTTLQLCNSRTSAKRLINSGKVRVNGEITKKCALNIQQGDQIEVVDNSEQFVSRSARKLLYALEAFQIDVSGALCLDIGASTGGFTEVLLKNGAQKVVALDVGHRQLAPEIACHPGVVNAQGRNVRDLSSDDLMQLLGAGAPPKFGVITADVSFISLEFVLPKVREFLAPNGIAVVLIKPQFELGRSVVKKFKNAVITDSALQMQACDKVIAYAKAQRLEISQALPSPVRGEHGNQEFLARVTPARH
jgi:23S rRNA (cytidine1920-2'-O)/16S rRNA (cytidine1409-2'-O)-methyltransferase